MSGYACGVSRMADGPLLTHSVDSGSPRERYRGHHWVTRGVGGGIGVSLDDSALCGGRGNQQVVHSTDPV